MSYLVKRLNVRGLTERHAWQNRFLKRWRRAYVERFWLISRASSLTAGEIADRFSISKPSVSKHLSILENAGLVISEKRGQFVHYTLVAENLINTLNGYVQEVCPVSRPLKRESKLKAAAKLAADLNEQKRD